MKRIAQLLLLGERYFGSGSSNSFQFLEFFELFKVAFTRELKNLSATNIEFSRGHFYLSGFFKVGEQYFYFSISDVRHGLVIVGNKPRLLVRTAQHNKDYTGGANRYVTIAPGIHKEIAGLFKLEVKEPSKRAKKTTEEIVAQILENKGFEGRIPSVKQAENIGFALLREFGEQAIITETKLGRRYVSAKFENEKAYFYYNADLKLLTVEVRV